MPQTHTDAVGLRRTEWCESCSVGLRFPCAEDSRIARAVLAIASLYSMLNSARRLGQRGSPGNT